MKIFKRIKKGFTLVELVVVIAVIAILAAVSVGAYFGVTESANASRLEQEAKQVYTAIQTVSLAPNDHSSLTSNGLVITNADLFADKLVENLGREVAIADTENVVVDNLPTIYFATGATNPFGGADITYKTFTFTLPEIGNKKATADVVSGNVNVVGATVTKVETNTDPEECEHNYESVKTPATCTVDGYTTHTCSLCGDSYTDSVVNATGHTPVVDEAVEATCTSTGLTEGSHCSECGETIVAQEPTAKKGHTYTSKVTGPTCTVDGYTTHTCSCGDSYTSNVVKASHKYTNHICEVCNAVESNYKIYYFDLSTKNSDNPWFAIYVWNDSVNPKVEAWFKLEKINDAGMYRTAIAVNKYQKLIVTRNPQSKTTLSFDGIWNQSGDITINTTYNCFAWDGDINKGHGTWKHNNTPEIGRACCCEVTQQHA